MKKITLVLFLSISGFAVKAQTLAERLTPVCQQLDSAKTTIDLMTASASFDLVTSQFPEEVMSNYYSAFTKALISYRETDVKKKDQYLDMANMYFDKVKQLDPENDETYVLAALLANARLSVDGANRWKEYGAIFDKNLESAKAIDPNNPRIYYMRGIAVFHTPKMFGGGGKKAKEHFVKANELFPSQDKSSVLKPTWGEKECVDFLKKCDE